MKGKDLFTGLGGISQKYYDQAENGTIAPARKNFRPFLAAAMIAMMLLLTGCGVAYLLRMNNLKVGEQAATKPVISADGLNIEGCEPVTYQTLTLAGLKGSDGYQASLEWYNFKQGFDPDKTILTKLYNEGKVPEYPEEYSYYSVYTQEMKDKLDSIFTTYNLKPIGTFLDFSSTKNLCTALNIEKIQTTQSGVDVRVANGTAFANGNFQLKLSLKVPDDGNGITTTFGNLLWNRKDCFSDDIMVIEDTGDWQEWNYTTSSGAQVLIVRSKSSSDGWIICDRPEAFLSVKVEARKDVGYNDDEGSRWEYTYMTDKQLEQIADAIDFSIQPKLVTKEDSANQASISNEATQDGYTVKLKSFETDGELAYLTLSITAPEGKDICHPTNPIETYYLIQSGGSGGMILTSPTQKEEVTANCIYWSEDDGDGKNNTNDYIYKMDASWSGMKKPFGPGTRWTFRMEDLIHSYWDGTNMVDDVLAQGLWQFDIPIGEKDGDFQEIELVKKPIKAQALTGSKLDGTDIFEDREITSFTLRSLSATIVSEGSPLFGGGRDQHIYVVMKDGSKVELQGMNGMTYAAASPIDVTKVDHVLMADGTKIPAPDSSIS